MKSGCYSVVVVLACAPAFADDLPGLYKPAANLWLNDPRVFVVDGTYHLYFQQPPRELGHAISQDLISWRRMPGGISRGPKGAWDDRDLCTSDVFYWQGTFYALYTARSDRTLRTLLEQAGLLAQGASLPTAQTFYFKIKEEIIYLPEGMTVEKSVPFVAE